MTDPRRWILPVGIALTLALILGRVVHSGLGNEFSLRGLAYGHGLVIGCLCGILYARPRA